MGQHFLPEACPAPDSLTRLQGGTGLNRYPSGNALLLLESNS